MAGPSFAARCHSPRTPLPRTGHARLLLLLLLLTCVRACADAGEGDALHPARGVGGRCGWTAWVGDVDDGVDCYMNFQRGTTWADLRRELTAWTDGVS